MKKLILAFILIPSICFAGTLVKYDKQTGDIIQTNDGVDEMPSDEILNDRFISDTTDVILVDEAVDITKKRVIDRQLVDIPEEELKTKEDKAEAEKSAREQKRKNTIAELKALGLSDEALEVLGIK